MWPFYCLFNKPMGNLEQHQVECYCLISKSLPLFLSFTMYCIVSLHQMCSLEFSNAGHVVSALEDQGIIPGKCTQVGPGVPAWKAEQSQQQLWLSIDSTSAVILDYGQCAQRETESDSVKLRPKQVHWTKLPIMGWKIHCLCLFSRYWQSIECGQHIMGLHSSWPFVVIMTI